MKYIAVLLTVFNRKAQTLSCLGRLYRQVVPEGVEMHVYLTNDGCTDGTPEAVKKDFPKVHIVEGDGTLFWNRGMWTAWEAASRNMAYDWYLWLNDDTELVPDAMAELLSESEKLNPQANIIVGATKASEGDKLTYGGRINDVIQPCDGRVHEIDCFNGNIVLVGKKAFSILGNLDYYFTHSRGDYDYAMRAKTAGVIMLQCGRALGICDVHPRPDAWRDPDVPLTKRWKMLHRPNGMPPKEIFHLEKRHYGTAIAGIHYCTIYLRCLFPALWELKRK